MVVPAESVAGAPGSGEIDPRPLIRFDVFVPSERGLLHGIMAAFVCEDANLAGFRISRVDCMCHLDFVGKPGRATIPTLVSVHHSLDRVLRRFNRARTHKAEIWSIHIESMTPMLRLL